jgi:branched-chain amino acid transport system substrate-binding protein
MYFPQGTAGIHVWSAVINTIARQTVPAGKTRLATLVCVEAQECANNDRVWSESAAAAGFQQVYRTKASLAQPDFTAECLNASNAKADVFLVAFDSNGIRRLAASCARQGYHPTFAAFSAEIQAVFKDDPNLDGMVGASNVFPYFQDGTPATEEYQRAMRSYGAGVPAGMGPPMGWVAGKLLEKAAANLAEPPTSEALLHGLWAIKDDTLGGLTHPLTFTENQPTTPRSCAFAVSIQHRAWKSPDGFTVHCFAPFVSRGSASGA